MKRPPPPAAPGDELRLCWGGRFDGPHDVSWHSHRELELVLVTAGTCEITAGDVVLAGGPRTLFVLPPGVAQYQRTLGPVRTTFVGLCAPAGLIDADARTLALGAGDPAAAWIEQLCDGPLVQPPLGREVTRALLAALLRRLAELEAAPDPRARRHPAVVQAMERIEADLARRWTLPELARAAGVSTSHLGGLFAADFGCGPLQYLQRRRFERAAWLLENPYLRVHEVAAACGYDDVNYFVRLFRRHHGHPPGRWRRRRVTPPRSS